MAPRCDKECGTIVCVTDDADPCDGPAMASLKLPFRSPYAAAQIFGFLGTRAVPGVETWNGTSYARTMGLAHGAGIVTLTPADGVIDCQLRLDDGRDLQDATHRCRRLLDLDADPIAIDSVLASDPILAPLVARFPGLRSPGHVDGAEVAVRAVLGQQVSVAGARTQAAKLTALLGEPLRSPAEGLTHLFPSSEALASMDPDLLGMPQARKRSLIGLCRAMADGDILIDPDADPGQLGARLLALPGIGPWTADYIAMRALSDPDVFLSTDLGIKHALVRLGRDGSPKAAFAVAQAWRPWRSYALHHLWNSLSS
jgi:AraC family transcriptional regulator, regulatory protein of adaptative response / DNA-3-methyladenine glycosylase II